MTSIDGHLVIIGAEIMSTESFFLGTLGTARVDCGLVLLLLLLKLMAGSDVLRAFITLLSADFIFDLLCLALVEGSP